MAARLEVRYNKAWRVCLSAVCVTAACALVPVCPGQDSSGARVSITPRAAPRRQNGPAAPIRIDVRLTLIPVTVTDPFGSPFSGLPREAFRLYEDGVEQQIKHFSSEDAPVSVGVVFDASRSMSGK